METKTIKQITEELTNHPVINLNDFHLIVISQLSVNLHGDGNPIALQHYIENGFYFKKQDDNLYLRGEKDEYIIFFKI